MGVTEKATDKASATELEPWQKADNWQNSAVATAVVTMVVGALFVAFWVFQVERDAEVLTRVQILGGFMAVGLAVVTFCTVVWRGLIAQEQANLQRQQIDRLGEQIKATDENNRAKLLLEGAELISDTSTTEKVAAGIAALKSVALSPGDQFTAEAMDLMIDYLTIRGIREHTDANVIRAIKALRVIHQRTGRIGNSDAAFRADERDDGTEFDTYWEFVVGPRIVSYRGGMLTRESVEINESTGNYNFDNVVFSNCRISITESPLVRNCEFVKCRVIAITNSVLGGATWIDCDFTDAVIYEAEGIIPLTVNSPRDNWFESGQPPRLAGGATPPVPWSRLFVERDRDAYRDD